MQEGLVHVFGVVDILYGWLSRFSTSLIPDLVLAEDFAACMAFCLDGASND